MQLRRDQHDVYEPDCRFMGCNRTVDTYSVISRTKALLSELKDAETGERGYVLTGDEAFANKEVIA